jgi:excisionase family DNA binding protein
METYLTAKEVAAKVQLSEQTIRRYTMLRQIPFHKIIRAVRYKPSEIEKWVEEREASKACMGGTDGI